MTRLIEIDLETSSPQQIYEYNYLSSLEFWMKTNMSAKSVAETDIIRFSDFPLLLWPKNNICPCSPLLAYFDVRHFVFPVLIPSQKLQSCSR